MPNLIGASGIQVKTYAEVIATLTTAFQTIYGADVNLDQNSPDGQMMNEIALMITDQGDLNVQNYDAKDPDQAVGVALDGVSQLCGIARRGGTYTQTDIVVTVDRNLNLDGTDTDTPFTVSDNSGNLVQLIASASLTTGANTLAFQAVDIGAVQLSINTLTTAATVILGVLSVNNPSVPTVIGVDQETDAAFRIRRQASVALPAKGPLASIVGGLYTVDGVSQVAAYENTGASADGDSIPGHGIWIIVNGGTDADVADMIYKYRPVGVPMKGTTTVSVEQVVGANIDIKFTKAASQALHMTINVNSLSGGSIDTTALKAGLAAAWTFGIYEKADITKLNTLVRSINTDLVVTTSGVSLTAGSYTATVLPDDKYKYFAVTTANIVVTTT